MSKAGQQQEEEERAALRITAVALNDFIATKRPQGIADGGSKCQTQAMEWLIMPYTRATAKALKRSKKKRNSWR